MQVLSPAMNACISTFTGWYNTKTQHRQLKWIHALGEATVRTVVLWLMAGPRVMTTVDEKETQRII